MEEMKKAFHIKDIKNVSFSENFVYLLNEWPLVLNAFLKIDPKGLPDRDSSSFESFGEEELKVLHDFYGTGKQFHLDFWYILNLIFISLTGIWKF